MSRPMIVSALVLSAMLLTPGAAPAQDFLGGDWSRIIRRRSCPVTTDCPPRQGLVWDTTNVLPPYPPALWGGGIGGDVVVSFQVGADGTVDSSSVTVVRASNTAFKAPAISTVRRWRFGFETEGRPSPSITAQVHLLYANELGCKDGHRQQLTGWAGPNQLVMGVCTPVVTRSQLRQPPK